MALSLIYTRRSRINHTCHQKLNPPRETVPLKYTTSSQYNFGGSNMLLIWKVTKERALGKVSFLYSRNFSGHLLRVKKS